MTEDSRSQSLQDAMDAGDRLFSARLATLVAATRELMEENPDPQQVGADLLAVIFYMISHKVTAACLAQAVRRIIDLEDLMRL